MEEEKVGSNKSLKPTSSESNTTQPPSSNSTLLNVELSPADFMNENEAQRGAITPSKLRQRQNSNENLLQQNATNEEKKIDDEEEEA